jgi:hypothetical protein
MSTVEFIYNEEKADIQCKENDKLIDIIQRFCIKVEKNIDKMHFLYNGSIVDKNTTFINLANPKDKQRSKISILANDDESMEQTNEQSLNKSKYIICQTYMENIRIKIQDYKIELYECQNSHTIENLSFKDFEKSQFIDESKIICNFCTTSNKSNT